jgi:hypothetical protein
MPKAWHLGLNLGTILRDHLEKLSREENGSNWAFHKKWNGWVNKLPGFSGFKVDTDAQQLFSRPFPTAREAQVYALALLARHTEHKNEISTLPTDWQEPVRKRAAEIKAGKKPKSVVEGAWKGSGEGYTVETTRKGTVLVVRFQPPEGFRIGGQLVYKNDRVPDTESNRAKIKKAHANKPRVKRSRELPEKPPPPHEVYPPPKKKKPLDNATNSPPKPRKPAARRGAPPPPPSLDARPAASRRRGPAARRAPPAPAPRAPPKRSRSARRESIETSDAPPPRRRAQARGRGRAARAAPAPAAAAPPRAPPPARRPAPRPAKRPRTAADRRTGPIADHTIINWASAPLTTQRDFEGLYRAHLDDKQCGPTASTYEWVRRAEELQQELFGIFRIPRSFKLVVPCHFQEAPGCIPSCQRRLEALLVRSLRRKDAEGGSLKTIVNEEAFGEPDGEGWDLLDARLDMRLTEEQRPYFRSIWELHFVCGEKTPSVESMVLWPTLLTKYFAGMAHLEGWERYVGGVRKVAMQRSVFDWIAKYSDLQRMGNVPMDTSSS